MRAVRFGGLAGFDYLRTPVVPIFPFRFGGSPYQSGMIGKRVGYPHVTLLGNL